ncbi:hypothetical protein BDZ97DRAFT_1924964 [Flammula alnicola]|nr:hypothetical protein BDZ97DRAFT_1925546 [Flammula alnicola]KAF8957015.1 hypothetical protein BDZ97DRAFT_1924964 [Flammula alnicola]
MPDDSTDDRETRHPRLDKARIGGSGTRTLFEVTVSPPTCRGWPRPPIGTPGTTMTRATSQGQEKPAGCGNETTLAQEGGRRTRRQKTPRDNPTTSPTHHRRPQPQASALSSP